MTSSPDFGPSCPSGGSWYACSNYTNFVGCCTVDACSSTGCPDGNLEPVAFNATYQGQFQDADCSGSAQFWTCATTDPTFMGCCESNPCSSAGCPAGQLRRATLPDNDIAASEYDAQPPLTSSTSPSESSSTLSTSSSIADSSTITTSSSMTAGPSVAASATITTTAATAPAQKTTHVAAIAGGIGGSMGGLLAILFFVWLVRRHAKKSSEEHQRGSRINAFPPSGTSTSYTDSGNEKPRVANSDRDSPSTVPAYSNEHIPAPQYPSGGSAGQMSSGLSHQYSYHSPDHGVVSPYQPYAPQLQSPSCSHQSQFVAGLSPTSGAQRPTSSRNGSDINGQKKLRYSSHQYVKGCQGPPQEMAGSEQESLHVNAGSGSGWKGSRSELSSEGGATNPL